MPNYCCGSLSIDCPNHVFEQIKDFVQGEKTLFDFEKILPMPDDADWYDWRCTNWGTKWNAQDVSLNGQVYVFWTAWSSCSPVIAALAKRFPEAVFRYTYTYHESGMCLCGVDEYKNGVNVYQLYGNYNSYYIYKDEQEPDYLISTDILERPDDFETSEKYIPGDQIGDAKTGKLYLHERRDHNSGYEIVADVRYLEDQPSYWW